MKPATRLAALTLLWLFSGISTGVAANDGECAEGELLEHTFASGAHWALCADVQSVHGLQVSAVHYQAPGDRLRSVLHRAHLGQILLHYHNRAQASAQINNPPNNLHRLLGMTDANCDGEPLLLKDGDHALCSQIEANPFLAKYSQRPSLHGQNWQLSAAIQQGLLTWTMSVTFSEDGQITPAVSASGRASEFSSDPGVAQPIQALSTGIVRATALVTWRLVFDLDTDAFDAVEEFEFPLVITQGNRRPMQVRQFSNEAYSSVNRETFRGWRVLDRTSGAGYYLDPANSGFSYSNNQSNWAQFDLAVTRYQDCERYASGNPPTQLASDCGESLDDFMSGELLADTHPTLWFSQSKTFNPSNEDWPVIGSFHQEFTLMPFDWTPSSPFELIE